MTHKIKLSGGRSTIGAFVRLSKRINPIFLTTDIQAGALKQYCTENGWTFTPVLMKTVAAVRDRYPLINSVLSRSLTLRRHIYVFDDVDISFAVEKLIDGMPFVTTPIIRNVNRKSLSEVSREVKLFADMPFHERPDIKPLLLFNRLPGGIKYMLLRMICQSHHQFRRFFGTIGFTNLGSLGVRYLNPQWLNTSVFGVGSLENRPVAVNNRLEIAPVLPVTMCFNHTVIDGCEAGRMLGELKRIIEEGDFRRFE